MRAPAKEGIRVKKRFFALLLCALLAVPAVPAGANSGPVYWENSPGLSLTPLQGSPAAVEREDLSFDFTASIPKDHTAGSRTSYSPQAMVTAAYVMKNTSSKAVSVTMAFPLIASLSELAGLHGVSVTAGGKKVPFDIAIGEPMPQEGETRSYFGKGGTLVQTSLPSFEKILNSVNQKPKALKILKGTGTRCDLRYPGEENRSPGDSEMWNRISLVLGNKYVVTTGFNGYSDRGANLELIADMDKTDTASFFSPESDLKALSITAAPDSKGNVPETPDLTYTDCTADSYFDWLVGQSSVYQAYPSPGFRTALRTAAMAYADGVMTGTPQITCDWLGSGTGSVVDDGRMDSFYEQNRILVLTYTVKFPANGTVPVSVSYPMAGAMDSEKMKRPVYTYGYLLNPAKGWAGFKNLNLSIRAPVKAPYLVKSSLSLSKTKTGTYAAQFASLPKTDLVFSLCSDPKGGS